MPLCLMPYLQAAKITGSRPRSSKRPRFRQVGAASRRRRPLPSHTASASLRFSRCRCRRRWRTRRLFCRFSHSPCKRRSPRSARSHTKPESRETPCHTPRSFPPFRSPARPSYPASPAFLRNIVYFTMPARYKSIERLVVKTLQCVVIPDKIWLTSDM